MKENGQQSYTLRSAHTILEHPVTARPNSYADGVIRRLAARYLLVLLTVAVLIVFDQAVIQPLLIRLDRFAPVINLSGRQRMLSQRLTKAALKLERAIGDQAAASQIELQKTLEQWSAAHIALQFGKPHEGIELISSRQIEQQWKLVEPHYVAMAEAARKILSDDEAQFASSVETIVDHERQFLDIMDHIVKLMESEAAREVQRLRTLALGIAATIVVLLVALGWFVVRPATHTIRAQVDELETRVEERTAELATTLDTLRFEVDEREKAESKNRRLAAQLAHADRVESIGHLAVGLAHELNHPLATIANYAEACDVLLRRDDQIPRSKLANFLVQIRDAALRGGKIVRRMRNFVQPNGNDIVETDIRSLITEILGLCQGEIEQNQVSQRAELGDRPMLVSVDPIQIQQVLVNLVQNAIHAMADTPTAKREIMIRTSEMADHVRIDVVDNGSGFDEINTERIFEPFKSTKSEGLGVGLSICRTIIENHRGIIWAESLPAGGAAISFTLPINPPDGKSDSRQAYSICC